MIDLEENLLIFTSLVFTTNVIAAMYKKDYIYALLFTLLIITSLIVHSSIGKESAYLNVMDKVAIFLIVMYGAYVLWNKNDKENIFMTSIIVSTFLFCIWVYYCGYVQEKYCFDKTSCVANQYHALMHIIASAGHNLIIFL